VSERDINTVLDEATDSVPVVEGPQPVAEKKKRIRCRILTDILNVCHLEPRKKTHIIYSVNLNFKIIRSYLKALKTGGLLNHRGELYLTTEKGSNWAHSMDLLLAEVGE
jgi:predicted transcriptional regulator